MRRSRVYSEMLPHAELVRPGTIALLERYGLELVLAVRPWDVGALPEVARVLRDAGVPLAIWPMLADEHGRWASIHNARELGSFTRSVCDALARAGTPPREVLFDLEPPFSEAQTLTKLATELPRLRELSEVGALAASAVAAFRANRLGGSRSAFTEGARLLERVASETHERGIATSVAVWPLVALDPRGEQGWQTLLGTPVDAVGADHVSVMMYTSILEGWSRGTVRRPDAMALLAAATTRTVRRWGASAGMSLGCVGVGAFSDEPTYRHPLELAEDVAIARAAGCETLTLFDLAGVLARQPAEAWLDAFVFGADVVSESSSRRVRAARLAARAMTWIARRR